MIQKGMDAAKFLAFISVFIGSLICMILIILMSISHEQKQYITECDKEQTLSFCKTAWNARADVFATKVMIP